jgi:hypothetical protein
VVQLSPSAIVGKLISRIKRKVSRRRIPLESKRRTLSIERAGKNGKKGMINVTRRDMIAGSLVGLTNLFLPDSWREVSSPTVKKGSTMSRFRLDPHNPRMPIWEHPEKLDEAAAADKVVMIPNAAVTLTAAESAVANVRRNRHLLTLGPQRRLPDEAGGLFQMIANQFGFDTSSPWVRQRPWLMRLFRAYFPVNEQALGFITFTPLRRPAPKHEAGIRVEHASPPWIDYVADRDLRRGVVPLGNSARRKFDLPLDGLRLAAVQSNTSDSQFVKIHVNRKVESERFGIGDIYGETWLCRGRPGADGDDPRLLKGQIPAVPVENYQAQKRLRTTPMLNFLKIDRRPFQGHLYLEFLGVELDPPSGGEVLSVRWGHMPLHVFLLNASPVEHLGLSQAFGKVLP